jgi:tetratricopeptide (TPR) repeat protein
LFRNTGRSVTAGRRLLYADQGKLEEAEKMYSRALVGKEKAWGPDHTSTLDTVNILGLLYASQGKLEEAEKMYKSGSFPNINNGIPFVISQIWLMSFHFPKTKNQKYTYWDLTK